MCRRCFERIARQTTSPTSVREWEQQQQQLTRSTVQELWDRSETDRPAADLISQMVSEQYSWQPPGQDSQTTVRAFMWTNRETFARVSTYLVALVRAVNWNARCSPEDAQKQVLMRQLLEKSAKKYLENKKSQKCRDKKGSSAQMHKMLFVSRNAYTSIQPHECFRSHIAAAPNANPLNTTLV